MVAPLVMEEEGWEALVEEECLAAKVDEDDEVVEAFFTFFTLTAERTFKASLIFRSFSSLIFFFFFSRWHLYRSNDERHKLLIAALIVIVEAVCSAAFRCVLITAKPS